MEDQLKHYGVLGMKWGRKKGTATTTSSSQRRMSNAELKSRINRLEMEQRLDRLQTPPKTKTKVDTLASALKTTATITTTALVIYSNMDKISKIANAAKKAT